MSDAASPPTGDGDPPISWGSTSPAATSESATSGGVERRLGFAPADLAELESLPDDLEALTNAVGAGATPFNGAFVPVVVHDTLLAERSYDAAEWAADLVRTAGGKMLAVATYGEPEWDGHGLDLRQWNHAAAMIERLEGVCQRFRLQIVVRETVGDVEVENDANLDPERPIAHILDTGRFGTDGFVPVELVCPERSALDGGLVDRFRGMLRDRT